MTTKSLSILTDPHPNSHIVYPYGDETHVTEAVGIFAGAGLRDDDAVVLITASERGPAIRRRLANEGLNVEHLEREGRLTFLDAHDLLSQFLLSGSPDTSAFNTLIGDAIAAARSKAPSGRVRLYGEMVNVLCGRNDLEAAAQVEELWNVIVAHHSVPLLCSYSNDLLKPHEHTGMPKRLLEAHTHVAA
jgi:hypothetical protein